MLIDTHCHLTHPRYDEDRLEVLKRARSRGVEGVVSIASDLDDAAALLDLVRQVEAVRDRSAAEGRTDSGPTGPAGEGGPAWLGTTVGVHPHQAGEAPVDLEERLEAFLDTHPSVVAVGECGLDFHYDFTPRARQHEVFQVHLEVAARRALPLVVHCREAEEAMTPLVLEAGRHGVKGVLHCFPGDLDLLEVAMEAGWYVSFTGLVTFRSFDGLEAVRRVPADRYMLETDGPYMAPVPNRGKRNEPGWVPHIRDAVAELRGDSPDDVQRATTRTALGFFAIDPSASRAAPGGLASEVPSEPSP